VHDVCTIEFSPILYSTNDYLSSPPRRLSELWRGTKNKTHTKFLQTEALIGYGKGSKFSKNDVDAIVHAMVFDSILEEISEESGSGFLADYVNPGSKAQQLQNGTLRFNVRFAAAKAAAPKEKTSKQKKSKKKKDDDGDKKPKAKTSKKSKSNETSPNEIDSPQDDLDRSLDRKNGSKRKAEKAILPENHTTVLLERIKKLVKFFAEEVSLSCH
jgi:superfamily II DNA helicase RecQ